jgi:formimidoylglutamate deiminase
MPSSFQLHCASALLPSGWARDVRLTIDGGVFIAVEPGSPAASGVSQLTAAVPGMPNLHSHAFQRGMAGLTEYRGPQADSFWSWRELMYRFLAHMTPDDVEAISAQAYVEMLEAGFTRVGEFHYVHRDPHGRAYADPAELSARIVAAAEQTGIGLTLLPVFYAHSGFGGAAADGGQRRFLLTLDEYARLLEACRGLLARASHANLGVAPHSLRAVTPDELTHVLALAERGPIHIHAAEQTREVDECLAWSGQRPVEWLLNHEAVDPRFCLIHATHMNADEAERLAKSGAVAGLCPITEANLGDGFFPALSYLAAGGHFGIGSDSNVQIGPADELRLLEYVQRLQLRARNLLGSGVASTGRALFDAALSGGARALGVPAGIQIGAAADLITLDASAPVFAGRSADQLLDSWLFAAAHGCIDGVWRAGVKLVEHGRHRARDVIGARYRDVITKLLAA